MVTTLDYDDYVGKIAIGRIVRGRLRPNQQVIITVPASFDEVSQQLTLEAARLAGFPAQTRLLEEPQAAFYYWLEQNNFGRDLDFLEDVK